MYKSILVCDFCSTEVDDTDASGWCEYWVELRQRGVPCDTYLKLVCPLCRDDVDPDKRSFLTRFLAKRKRLCCPTKT